MRYLLFLLSLIAISNAALNCTDFSTLTSFTTDALSMFLSSLILLIILAIAIAYAFGNSFGRPDLVIWAKDEMYHLGISILVLMGLGALFSFSCLTINSFAEIMFSELSTELGPCYSSTFNMFSSAVCYSNKLESDAESLAEVYVRKYISELQDSAYIFSIAFPIFNQYTVPARAYKRVVSNQYNMVLNFFVVPSLMSIKAQKLILLFIERDLIKLMLPAAILLRFIPPLRQAGNFMLAIALALYVILPFFYLFGLTTYDLVFTESTCNGSLKYALYEGVLDEWSTKNTCNYSNAGLLSLMRLIPQAVFLPNLSLTMTLLFIMGVNKALRTIG